MIGALFCVWLTAAQEPSAQKAHHALQRARSLATQMKVTEAVAAFEEAAALFQRVHPELTDRAAPYACWIEIGAAWIAQRKEDRADAAFRRALAFDAARVPSPKLYPPDVIERFARVKKEMLKKPSATLSVTSRPEGAIIWLDGVKVGPAPRSISGLIEGEHWLALEAPGYEVLNSVVVLGAGKVERADVFLNAHLTTPAPSASAPVEPKAATAETKPMTPLPEPPPTVTVATPIHRRAWFWVVIGAAVVGAGVGLGLGLGLGIDSRPGAVDLVIQPSGR